jgi:hypothetical protein
MENVEQYQVAEVTLFRKGEYSEVPSWEVFPRLSLLGIFKRINGRAEMDDY